MTLLDFFLHVVATVIGVTIVVAATFATVQWMDTRDRNRSPHV